MSKRKLWRVRRWLGFEFLMVIVLMAGAVPLLAWNPVITADYECLSDGTYEVSGHATPWAGEILEDRTNPDIEIRRGGYDGDLVKSGEFAIVNGDVPGFDWTDSTKFPGNETQDVTYVAVAKATWGGTGEEPRDADNLHPDQTTTIKLPGTCKETQPPTATVTATATPSATGAIGDWVWEDTNQDGYQSDFEFGIADVQVNLLNSGGLVTATTFTDTTGHYLFTGLPAGTYQVQFIVPAGYELSPLVATPVDRNNDAGVAGRTGPITLGSGQTDLTWDAGMFGVARVLPQVITAPATTVAQTSETLPFTGVADGLFGGVALALLMLGGLVVLSIQRRDGDAVVVADDWHSRLKVYDLKYW